VAFQRLPPLPRSHRALAAANCEGTDNAE
jgi:hypothetical protein